MGSRVQKTKPSARKGRRKRRVARLVQEHRARPLTTIAEKIKKILEEDTGEGNDLPDTKPPLETEDSTVVMFLRRKNQNRR